MTRDEIRDIAHAFLKSRVLLTAYELGLFTALGGISKTSGETAAVLKTDPRATDRLMNALCAIGLLTKQQGMFSNTPASLQFLVEEYPDFLAGLMHTAHLWHAWSTLTDAVRNGRTVLHRDVNERGEEWLSAFIAAMHDRASKTALQTVTLLDLSGVRSVLDVGGGSGAYAMAFVRAGENIHTTVFDLPNVVPLTQSYVEREGLTEKIHIIPGDYLRDDLGTDYDLVFLSAIVHSNSGEQNSRLIRKCADALRPNGSVVVQDFVMDDDRVHPEHGALFSLNMLVGTDAGDTFTEAEIRSWMDDAGLSGIYRQETPFGTTQIIGRKSAVTPADCFQHT